MPKVHRGHARVVGSPQRPANLPHVAQVKQPQRREANAQVAANRCQRARVEERERVVALQQKVCADQPEWAEAQVGEVVAVQIQSHANLLQAGHVHGCQCAIACKHAASHNLQAAEAEGVEVGVLCQHEGLPRRR